MAKPEYHVMHWGGAPFKIGANLTKGKKDVTLGPGYYVTEVTGQPGDYNVVAVDGPYTPATAEARAEEWRNGRVKSSR